MNDFDDYDAYRALQDEYRRQHPRALYHLDLRYCLTELMCSTPERVWRVRELVEHLQAEGFDLGEHPSQTVSNHLRAEVSRGRVRRVGWGKYRGGWMPGATRRRIRKRARLRRQWLAEHRAEQQAAAVVALLDQVRSPGRLRT